MTTRYADMVRTHPSEPPIDEKRFVDIVELIFECAKTCTVCGDACMSEGNASCATSCQTCGELCLATARALSRMAAFNRAAVAALVAACEEFCRICGDECASHGQYMEHCRICGETCRQCADACRDLLEELQAA